MFNLPKTVAKIRLKYHMEMLDVNNILNQLGIMSDEKCEERQKYHTMTIFGDIFPRLGWDVSELKKEEK